MARKIHLIYKKPLLLTLVIIAAAIAFYGFHKLTGPKVSSIPKPTITQLPVHKNPNNGDKEVSAKTDTAQGTASDTKGQAVTDTKPSQWLQSASGNITVKQPQQGATLSPGFVLAGAAKVDQVQYRLMDNVRGVISQGFLSVVNGNFSGSVNFSSSGNTGRLDVFSMDSSGREVNEVQMNVNF